MSLAFQRQPFLGNRLKFYFHIFQLLVHISQEDIVEQKYLHPPRR
jgi:hypothetical protein